MENYPKTHSHRHASPSGKQHLPCLFRSKSGTPATSPLLTPTTTLNTNPGATNKSRSKSTVKARTKVAAEENRFMINATQATKKKPPQQEISNTRDGMYVTFLPRKTPTSPSAWALSPGRVSPCSPVVPHKSPSSGGRTNGGGGGMSGVLKYFRQKKVASMEDVDHHSFKVMHDRLLQWRFANARAETTMANVKFVAEKKAFNAWVKILALRNSNMGKQVQIQKLRHEIRLRHIVNSQLCLLEKWSMMEAKNLEAVGRVVRKLSAASISLPLINDAKGDILRICDAMDKAMRLIESVEPATMKLYSQVERSCYLVTELTVIVKQEREYLRELHKWMLIVASLKQEEKSLRAHLMQVIY